MIELDGLHGSLALRLHHPGLFGAHSCALGALGLGVAARRAVEVAGCALRRVPLRSLSQAVYGAVHAWVILLTRCDLWLWLLSDGVEALAQTMPIVWLLLSDGGLGLAQGGLSSLHAGSAVDVDTFHPEEQASSSGRVFHD